MNNVKFRLKNLIFLLSVIVGMIIALEILAQFLITKKVLEPIKIDDFRPYRFDSKLGWAPVPNLEGIHKTDEFEYHVKHNSYGMRYKEFSKDKSSDLYRVAILGDSFTYGTGVADFERFTNKVEEFAENKIEMLNFGVSGYGPTQYYLLLDEIIKYKPDMILIAFFLGNDFADSVIGSTYSYYKPYATMNINGNLEIQGYPIPNRIDSISNPKRHLTWIEKNYFIAYRLGLLFQKISSRIFDNKVNQRGLFKLRDNKYKDFYLEGSETDNIEEVNKAIAINALLLEKIKERLESNKIKLVVLNIPSKFEYGVEFGVGWGGDKKKNLKLHKRLITTLETLDIDHIELINDITPEDFWDSDGHWRASGHEKAGKKILEFLTNQNLIK